MQVIVLLFLSLKRLLKMIVVGYKIAPFIHVFSFPYLFLAKDCTSCGRGAAVYFPKIHY